MLSVRPVHLSLLQLLMLNRRRRLLLLLLTLLLLLLELVLLSSAVGHGPCQAFSRMLWLFWRGALVTGSRSRSGSSARGRFDSGRLSGSLPGRSFLGLFLVELLETFDRLLQVGRPDRESWCAHLGCVLCLDREDVVDERGEREPFEPCPFEVARPGLLRLLHVRRRGADGPVASFEDVDFGSEQLHLARAVVAEPRVCRVDDRVWDRRHVT